MRVEWQIAIARRKAKCYICHKTLIKCCILSCKQSSITTHPQFYNYYKQYGGYRTVKPFDPPTQNTII